MTTVRQLILELRKIGNHDALVKLDVKSRVSLLRSIETQAHAVKVDTVYLRDLIEKPGILSSSRRCVYSETDE